MRRIIQGVLFGVILTSPSAAELGFAASTASPANTYDAQAAIIQIVSASYISSRMTKPNSRACQFDEKARALCDGKKVCVLSCDNTLCGDPDIGYAKACKVLIACKDQNTGWNRTEERSAGEARSLTINCVEAN